MSFFELSGPIGMLLRVLLEDFFGIGKWLVPFVCFGLAIFLFNKNEEEEYYFGTGLGIFLILLSLLGLGDLFESGLTGKFGWILGSLENIIGFFPSLIAFILLFLVGLVVDFWQIFKSYLKNRKEKFALTKPEKKGLLKIRMPEGKVERLLPNEEVEQILDEERPVIASFLKSKKFKKAFVDASGWEFPPLDLLEVDGAKPTVGDIRINSQVIQRTLEDFGIPVEMGEVNIGPTVTQYTLKPAQGVKLSRIVALQNDLALALAAHPLRIEAPIPGKSLVGIEVPNKTPSLVRLRSLLESPAYNESPAALLFPLGRDVMGNAVMADISKLPHLLVAGATGTGKSIFIHSVITSLIYRNSPQNLRFILIDPKRVELSAYENIPYLLCPVILEGKKAIMALKWATQEMERRY
ncbi:MAG: translocase FtsK protein, partial [Parcubacteria group bacterium GW2011_GWB1_41_4]